MAPGLPAWIASLDQIMPAYRDVQQSLDTPPGWASP